jgi:hypothetical protein
MVLVELEKQKEVAKQILLKGMHSREIDNQVFLTDDEVNKLYKEIKENQRIEKLLHIAENTAKEDIMYFLSYEPYMTFIDLRVTSLKASVKINEISNDIFTIKLSDLGS